MLAVERPARIVIAASVSEERPAPAEEHIGDVACGRGAKENIKKNRGDVLTERLNLRAQEKVEVCCA